MLRFKCSLVPLRRLLKEARRAQCNRALRGLLKSPSTGGDTDERSKNVT